MCSLRPGGSLRKVGGPSLSLNKDPHAITAVMATCFLVPILKDVLYILIITPLLLLYQLVKTLNNQIFKMYRTKGKLLKDKQNPRETL